LHCNIEESFVGRNSLLSCDCFSLDVLVDSPSSVSGLSVNLGLSSVSNIDESVSNILSGFSVLLSQTFNPGLVKESTLVLITELVVDTVESIESGAGVVLDVLHKSSD